jgi:osmoprotectant transport system permease protein
VNWAALFERVTPLLASHVVLAASAMLLGLVIALPLGVFAARHQRFRRAVLGFASIIQTIPSLALLALFYPLLLAIGTQALGFLPSLLALSLYALLPILRNTVDGLNGIDPAIVEAADGIGMTLWQKLRIVEAPLAITSVMGGVRTAAVWTIGAATLSTTVGYPSLGDIIFSGLQTQNWVLVLTGCVTAAGLALIVDAMLASAQHGIENRRRWFWIVPLAAAAMVPVGIAIAQSVRPSVVTIGAKSFSEQYILARVIGSRLEAAGYRVRYKENLGSAVVFSALAGNDVDVYVDYSGTLWANEMKRRDVVSHDEMNRLVADWARGQHGVTMLGPLGFENAYALAMRGDRASGVKSLEDLARIAPGLTLGGDLEFLDRPEWKAIREGYDLRFARTRAFSPTFMYDALKSGDADVISAFSSDGRIAADDLVVLTDPKGVIPGYDALLLLGPKAGRDARLVATLRPMIGVIPVATMQRANLMVDGEKQSPEAAARWLDGAIQKRSRKNP